MVDSTVESPDFAKVATSANYLEGYAFSLVCLVSFLGETFNNDGVVFTLFVV